VSHPALDLYADAFVARHSRESGGRQDALGEPGIRGVVPAATDQPIRLLVIDDRGYGRLAAHVTATRSAVVDVLDGAARCAGLLRRSPGWRAEPPTTAMALRDVGALPAAAVPDGLALRPVNRLAAEAPDGVPLADAVAVVVASDPRLAERPDAFARFLRTLPSSVRLLAAVDGDGVARATSGYDVFGARARVFFVNTEPGWRRRGVGRAMTVAALRGAVSRGARRIVLDATDAGASLYACLGFEPAGRLTRYRRP
jgi:GNAT superfamily N-acetyltransferase